MLLASIALAGVLAESAPELIRPTYSIRDASRNIARVFPQDASVRTVMAGALLLETGIQYREALPPDKNDVGILTFFKRPNIPESFVLLGEYPVAVHPQFCARRSIPAEHCKPAIYTYHSNQRPR